METRNAEIAAAIAAMAESVLCGPGETPAELRRAVESRTARMACGERAELPVADPWAAFVDRIAEHADEVTDADIHALTVSGCSEEAIFEVTIAAALGAARARLEKSSAVLEGLR